MRIAYFNATMCPGQDGVTRVIQQMVHGALRRGWRVLAIGAAVPEGPQVVPFLRVPSVTLPVHRAYRLALPSHRFFARGLRAFGPDLLHVNSPCTLGFAALDYARRHRLPIVGTYHTHFPAYLRYYHLGALEGLAWALTRRFYGRLDRTFVPAVPILRELEGHGLRRLQHLPNGVDLGAFGPGHRSATWRERLGREDEPVVLFVSRLVWEKDLRVLAEAYQSLRARRDDFRMVVVGDGHARPALEAMMPGAFFLGYQQGPALAESYASSDLFAFPSTTETFGLVTLEAMASGLVPVAAAAGGATAIVEDGRSGLLAAPHSASDLAAKIAWLLDHPDARRRLAAQAIRRAEDFGWQRLLHPLFDCYQELVERSSRRRSKSRSRVASDGVQQGPRSCRPVAASHSPRVLLVAMAAIAAGAGRGAEPSTGEEAPPPAAEAVAMGPVARSPAASELPGVSEARRAADLGPVYRRNAWVPLLEVGVMEAGLNFVDRQMLKQEWARSDPQTAARNLGMWRFDGDSFEMNNLLHPYTGSLYYGISRSMGLGPWWSFGVTSLGSALWEIGGETEPASINDQIMTSVGGSLLGEALYRSAVLVLTGGNGARRFWREGAALALSPPTGVNRMMFGDRYRAPEFDEDPVTYLEASAGVALDPAPERKGEGPATAAALGLHLVYGLPDEDGWPVLHPFDHFDLQLGLRFIGRESPFALLFVRGMLAASRIEGAWNGIWGLTGIYDYAAPSALQVSTAALGVSTTGQVGRRGGVTLQGTALLGAGFGTGGAAVAPAGGPGGHRGPAAQLVLEGRLLLADRAAIGAGVRQYLVAGAGDTRGLEAQQYLTLSGRLRLAGRHALGVEWQEARRWSRCPDVPDSRQRSSELSVSWVLATDAAFGARPRRREPGRPPPSVPRRWHGRARKFADGVLPGSRIRELIRGGAMRTGATPGRAGALRRARVLAAALLLVGPASRARGDEPEDRWERGEARAFWAGRLDLGTVQHLGLAGGWGKPHWTWGGAEAHGWLGLDFAAASADLRLALLVVDLSAGLRITHAFRHVPLPDQPSHDGLPKAGGFSYRTFDLFASGVVPTPGGLALWEVNAVRFLDPPADAQIYEEWLRVVCAPPWCAVARLAWAARLRGGALYLGAGAEWAFADGRPGPELVRLGPVASWRLSPHLALQGALYVPVSDPDHLALLDRVNGVVVVTWTFASGDPPPCLP